MLRIWNNRNYWRITGWIMIIGILLSIIGFAMAGFNMDSYQTHFGWDIKPWYNLLAW